MSQENRIVEYLKAGNQITPIDAVKKFNCLSLSQRMGDARRRGIPIRSTIIKVASGKRVAVYWMSKVKRDNESRKHAGGR